MAEVTSYTATKILELLQGLAAVESGQQTLQAVIQDLTETLDAAEAERIRLQQEVLPVLQADLINNQLLLDELNETTLVNLRQELENSEATIEDLRTVTIAALQQELASAVQTLAERPIVYNQPDEPTNPDINDRYLIVGDTWFDTDDGNKQDMWNGSTWSTYAVDIPDLSLTVRKFKLGTHLIY